MRMEYESGSLYVKNDPLYYTVLISVGKRVTSMLAVYNQKL